MNCIIIEDEPLAMLRMKKYVGKVPFLQLLGTFENGLEAIGFLQTEKVDLVFLDIQMDEFSGIQFLESLAIRPEVILTTAFDQYAIKAFELQVADYLLKPFAFERFLQAVARVQGKLLSGNLHLPQRPFMFIKTGHRLQKVLLEEILFIEGMRDYRKIHCVSSKIMTLETFSSLEEKLPRQQFCRVHKSFLVAIDKIESIEGNGIKIQKEIIPISETYKEAFYKLVKYH
jgi:two-component system LytT family response regulator